LNSNEQASPVSLSNTGQSSAPTGSKSNQKRNCIHLSEEKKRGKFGKYTQWLDWIRPMSQKSRLTLKKKRTLANSKGW